MFYTILDFPLGKIFLAKSEKGLSLASSLKNRNRFEEITEFFKRKSILLELQRKKFHREEKLFSQYFEGKKEDFTSLPLDFISGTPYQRKVWLETRKIPYGKTQTYKSLAIKLNHRGYRSIGQALSRNPLLIVIPCHRVLSSDGSIGGFTGGLELKKFLLRLEKP
ncbi:MAG: methylated-DNA--[protein]-cysteine S-methyltransferase [Candidatus Aminicenantes bacterium]|nr:MAG: methylated-DNA--[protein]-cysteine S-methyltransferase [Candidatus Aminicenantes bacterium]